MSDWSSDVCSSDLRGLEHGELLEDRSDLIGAHQTRAGSLVAGQVGDVAATKHDASAVRSQFARELVDQGGLARAVGADHRVDLTILDVQRDGVCHQQAAVALRSEASRVGKE